MCTILYTHTASYARASGIAMPALLLPRSVSIWVRSWICGVLQKALRVLLAKLCRGAAVLRGCCPPGFVASSQRVAARNDSKDAVDGLGGLAAVLCRRLRLLLRPVQATLGKHYCCAEACLEGLYRCSMSSCNKHDLPGGSAGLCP